MPQSRGWVSPVLWGVLACLGASGCLGPHSLPKTRIKYNEAVKRSSEEQLLLNIVRLRYADTPSSLQITSVAAQSEISFTPTLVPFFLQSFITNNTFTRFLPEFQGTIGEFPTFSLTPQDDREFTRRLFTPLSAETITYIIQSTWPYPTVMRMWLEYINRVPNAVEVSSPPSKRIPEFEQFLHGIRLINEIDERKQAQFFNEMEDSVVIENLNDARFHPTGKEILEASDRKMSYVLDEKTRTWKLVTKRPITTLRFHKDALGTPEYEEFCRIFHLKLGLTRYPITVGVVDPHKENIPPEGLDKIDFDTRSLAQVLFYLCHAVCVPPSHIAKGYVVLATLPDGTPYNYDPLFEGLFKVCSAKGLMANQVRPCRHQIHGLLVLHR